MEKLNIIPKGVVKKVKSRAKINVKSIRNECKSYTFSEDSLDIRKSLEKLGLILGEKIDEGSSAFIYLAIPTGLSGSGKSTFLRTLNQLETISGGTILIDEVSLTDRKTNINKVREEVGMVFQSFNLFPHKTALGNVALSPMKVLKKWLEEVQMVVLIFL